MKIIKKSNGNSAQCQYCKHVEFSSPRNELRPEPVQGKCFFVLDVQCLTCGRLNRLRLQHPPRLEIGILDEIEVGEIPPGSKTVGEPIEGNLFSVILYKTNNGEMVAGIYAEPGRGSDDWAVANMNWRILKACKERTGKSLMRAVLINHSPG